MKSAKTRTNKIVEFKEIKEKVIADMQQARDEHPDETHRVTNRENQLAKSVISALSKKTKARGVLSLETYNRYVTKIRTAIKVEGFVHPSYIKNLGRIAKQHKKYSKRILRVAELPYSDSKNALFELIETIKHNATKAKVEKTRKACAKLAVDLKQKCLLNIDPAILKKLIRTEAEHDKMTEKADNRIKVYQDEASDKIYIYSDIVALIPELLSVSPASVQGWEKLALGIALATGRRSIEIFHRSEFSPAKGRNIKITGFAKKRGKQAEAATIPCLADPKQIIDAVNKLRNYPRIANVAKRIDELKNEDERHEIFNNSVHQQTALLATKILGKHLTDRKGKALKSTGKMGFIASLKDARDLYINCAYKEYKTAGGQLKISAFTQGNLNHEQIGTALSYLKFDTLENVNKSKVRKARAIKTEKANRVEGLEKLLNSEKIQGRAPYFKVVNFVLEQVKADPDYIADTGKLRRAVPNGKGGFKPIVKPQLIGEVVAILKGLELDYPA